MNNETIKRLQQALTKPIVIFDLETTGLDVEKDEIIQFAAIRVDSDKETQVLEFICCPNKPIDSEAAEVHGITQEYVVDFPPFGDYAAKVYNFFEGAIVSGYNIRNFDLPLLQRQMVEQGYDGFLDDNEVYDAFEIYKEHSGRKLVDACEYYGKATDFQAHDAMADILATMDVTVGQLDKEGQNLDEVRKKYEKPLEERLSKWIDFTDPKNLKWAFSKNKGQPLDVSFAKWIIGRDFPNELKKFLRNHYGVQ